MAGRPRAVIDWAKVDEYLEAGCTGTGIADILGIHPNTLYLACQDEHKCDFSAYSQQKRQSGDDILRKTQFDLAKAGDGRMLIWLGKQRLDQKDKHEQKVVDDIVVKYEIVYPEEDEG